MDVVAYLVRDAAPNYFASVPIPSSLKGFVDLSAKEWLHLATFSAVVGAGSYFAVKPYYDKYLKEPEDKPMNFDIRMDEPKVADIIDVEDLGENTSFCRCWKSKKWPFCDGSHNAHNKASGDNLGSLKVRRKIPVTVQSSESES